MAEFLPGRTENSIKNRFYSNLRKYVKYSTVPKPNAEPMQEKPGISLDERMMELLKVVENLETMLQNTRKELVELEAELDLN